MRAQLVETLSLPQRLALSYAPRAVHPATLALLALDQRLAAILRGGGEPIIAQMKLAWWRDRLGENSAGWPEGEPLLALLRQWPGDLAPLRSMVDGWEILLADELDQSAVREFATARGQGWAGLAAAHAAQAVEQAGAAGAYWALVDLSLNLGNPQDRAFVRELVPDDEPRGHLRDRALRPLAVLEALSRRAYRKDEPALLHDRGAALLALRVGITGR